MSQWEGPFAMCGQLSPLRTVVSEHTGSTEVQVLDDQLSQRKSQYPDGNTYQQPQESCKRAIFRQKRVLDVTHLHPAPLKQCSPSLAEVNSLLSGNVWHERLGITRSLNRQRGNHS